MTNYSDDASHCRVDFFKESGKWYTTEAVIFGGQYYEDKEVSAGWMHPLDKFKEVLKNHLKLVGGHGYRMRGMIAICLEPYFENCGYPLMVRIPEEGEW
jgi:hypothetical protein